ncbi:MAG: DegT/DnrJ/EryC1/StrS family aminotransferase [Gallionella sp.]|nr:DegT/DnrJ/EryC1/StrS family aminotransferase [Gallionella sp.]
MKVEFFKHNVSEDDISRVHAVLHNAFLTTGKEVKTFEEMLASYLGAKYGVGLTSCTAALHLALLACDIGAGDEVITTPMTFIATSNTVLYSGASHVFVDVEHDTGLIDVTKIEAAITPKTKAIIPVHLYGQMCDMKAIRIIADKHGLVVIEDCAHAIESNRDGIRPGQLGEIACFSFYATKNITSGEGGAIVTNSQILAEKIKLLRQHGMSASAADRYTSTYRHWDMEMLGWKYNMSNIQAALLIGQISRIDNLLDRREDISRKYEEAFSVIEGLRFPRIHTNSKSARHLFTVWVAPDHRDQILGKLQEDGVGVAVNYRAVHLLKYYRDTFGYARGMFPVAERIGDSTITIPLYPKLLDSEVDHVIKSVIKAVG